MKENTGNLEPKYNIQIFSFGFLVSFVIGFIGFYFLLPITTRIRYNSTGLLILVSMVFIWGIIVGAMVMFGTRRKVIKTTFIHKKDFLDKINISLFQLRYVKELDTEYFVSYKPSIGLKALAIKTNIAFDKNTATISGPIGIIKKLEKNI